MTQGFVPPPYPYDRLDAFKGVASKFDGGVIDLSVGDPCDPPSAAVIAALSSSNLERGYPPSIGIEPLRAAVRSWMQRKFDIDIPLSQIAAAVGSKEYVVTTPQWMKLRTPSRDTVLFPAVSYPSYAMGATLSGCRPVAVPMTPTGGVDLSKISADDAKRALMIWMNSPSNPTGALDDMEAVVNWGRANDVPVFSDECYVEFTWQGKPTTALQYGTQGVIALHSLSKRSNLAGLRVAFYAGDADIVHYLKEVRKHAGLMVPGPAQADRHGGDRQFPPWPASEPGWPQPVCGQHGRRQCVADRHGYACTNRTDRRRQGAGAGGFCPGRAPGLCLAEWRECPGHHRYRQPYAQRQGRGGAHAGAVVCQRRWS